MWTGTYVEEYLSIVLPSRLDTNVKMLFQRQHANLSAIEILFEEVTAIHIKPSLENYVSLILDAIVLKNEDDFYWADNFEWHSKDNPGACSNWISAKKMKWREVSEWMGSKNRYAVDEN